MPEITGMDPNVHPNADRAKHAYAVTHSCSRPRKSGCDADVEG